MAINEGLLCCITSGNGEGRENGSAARAHRSSPNKLGKLTRMYWYGRCRRSRDPARWPVHFASPARAPKKEHAASGGVSGINKCQDLVLGLQAAFRADTDADHSEMPKVRGNTSREPLR
jgi:hypothetical protein